MKTELAFAVCSTERKVSDIFSGPSLLTKWPTWTAQKSASPTTPVMRGLVKGLGASPTVVNYNELYSALQTGVVDAAEQPIANYKSKAFNEVAPYMILDGHTLGAIQVIITDEAWNELSANQQNALVEAGKLASAFNRELSEGAENKVLKEPGRSRCNRCSCCRQEPLARSLRRSHQRSQRPKPFPVSEDSRYAVGLSALSPLPG